MCHMAHRMKVEMSIDFVFISFSVTRDGNPNRLQIRLENCCLSENFAKFVSVEMQ